MDCFRAEAEIEIRRVERESEKIVVRTETLMFNARIIPRIGIDCAAALEAVNTSES
jgi:hypothetical protein